jgi:hypothetical protein
MGIPDSLSDLWEYKVSTRAELLALIDRFWTAINAYVDGLTPEQLTQVKNPDGWALKDHLTHLTVWERSVIAFLKGNPRYEALGITEAMYRNESYDAMNEAIFRNHQHEPLDTVLAQWRTTHHELIAALTALEDDDLQKPYNHFQPDEADRLTPRRAIDVIFVNTAPHFREHQEWMQQTLDAASHKSDQ